MPRFAAGVVRFQNEVFPEKRALFEKLSHGQSPEALFITCSDSRIETAMITQTEPGELFIVRNAGNIVPPHVVNAGGITASIEFAAAALNVPHIVICGHTGCGAMEGALKPELLKTLPHVREWLAHAQGALDYVDQNSEGLSEDERMALLLEENVRLQLEHLKTHPSVAARIKKGDVQLHGWVYDIKTGGVEAWDEDQQKFLPVDERYAAEMAALAAGDCRGK
jgi:carbonic anhydrase